MHSALLVVLIVLPRQPMYAMSRLPCSGKAFLTSITLSIDSIPPSPLVTGAMSVHHYHTIATGVFPQVQSMQSTVPFKRLVPTNLAYTPSCCRYPSHFYPRNDACHLPSTSAEKKRERVSRNATGFRSLYYSMNALPMLFFVYVSASLSRIRYQHVLIIENLLLVVFVKGYNLRSNFHLVACCYGLSVKIFLAFIYSLNLLSFS